MGLIANNQVWQERPCFDFRNKRKQQKNKEKKKKKSYRIDNNTTVCLKNTSFSNLFNLFVQNKIEISNKWE